MGVVGCTGQRTAVHDGKVGPIVAHVGRVLGGEAAITAANEKRPGLLEVTKVM